MAQHGDTIHFGKECLNVYHTRGPQAMLCSLVNQQNWRLLGMFYSTALDVRIFPKVILIHRYAQLKRNFGLWVTMLGLYRVMGQNRHLVERASNPFVADEL